jgi:RNA recognition motif-containing protein
MDIVTKKAESMRGQAFIVFQNIKSAQRAKQDLEGYNIFDKEMVTNFRFTDLTLTIGN